MSSAIPEGSNSADRNWEGAGFVFVDDIRSRAGPDDIPPEFHHQLGDRDGALPAAKSMLDFLRVHRGIDTEMVVSHPASDATTSFGRMFQWYERKLLSGKSTFVVSSHGHGDARGRWCAKIPQLNGPPPNAHEYLSPFDFFFQLAGLIQTHCAHAHPPLKFVILNHRCHSGYWTQFLDLLVRGNTADPPNPLTRGDWRAVSGNIQPAALDNNDTIPDLPNVEYYVQAACHFNECSIRYQTFGGWFVNTLVAANLSPPLQAGVSLPREFPSFLLPADLRPVESADCECCSKQCVKKTVESVFILFVLIAEAIKTGNRKKKIAKFENDWRQGRQATFQRLCVRQTRTGPQNPVAYAWNHGVLNEGQTVTISTRDGAPPLIMLGSGWEPFAARLAQLEVAELPPFLSCHPEVAGRRDGDGGGEADVSDPSADSEAPGCPCELVRSLRSSPPIMSLRLPLDTPPEERAFLAEIWARLEAENERLERNREEARERRRMAKQNAEFAAIRARLAEENERILRERRNSSSLPQRRDRSQMRGRQARRRIYWARKKQMED